MFCLVSSDYDSYPGTLSVYQVAWNFLKRMKICDCNRPDINQRSRLKSKEVELCYHIVRQGFCPAAWSVAVTKTGAFK